MCVKEVLTEEGTVDDIVVRYNISARQILRDWIKSYNANRELKDYDPKKQKDYAERYWMELALYDRAEQTKGKDILL